MKPLSANRILRGVAAVVMVAGLAIMIASCQKDSDESKPDMKTAMPVASQTPAKTEMKMGDMPMPASSQEPAKVKKEMGDMPMPSGKPAEQTAEMADTETVVPGRGPVDFNQTQRQFINIRTRPVTRGHAVVTIRAVGIVAYDESKFVNVNARIMGWAEKLYVDKPGQFVVQGGPLLDIYSPELYTAQNEYLLSYHNSVRLKHILPPSEVPANSAISQETISEAKALLKSSRKRLKLWEVTDDQIRTLESTGKPTDTIQLRSPVSGYVIQKNIEPAQMIRLGMALYRIADLSTIWINADIYEYELPLVKIGQKVAVTAVAHPGRVFEAKVDFIYPYSENKTRTTTARLVMDNRAGLFKPDTYVNAEIKVDQGERLLAPATAVFDTGTWQYVFVEAAKGNFIPKRILLGAKVGEQFIVNEGLAEGEKVVVDGNFLLDSESQLRAAGSGGGHQH